MLTDEAKASIVEGLSRGVPYRTLAKQAGTSLASISRIAAQVGTANDEGRARTRIATRISLERRLAVFGAVIHEVARRIRRAKNHELQSMALAAAVASDKIELLTGGPTSRSEISHGAFNSSISRKLAAIAVRLRTGPPAKEVDSTEVSMSLPSPSQDVAAVSRDGQRRMERDGQEGRAGRPGPSPQKVSPETVSRLRFVAAHSPDLTRRRAAADELHRLGEDPEAMSTR